MIFVSFFLCIFLERGAMPTLLELKVVPQAGKQGFVRDKNGIIKCFLKSPPEDGKANQELIKLLSKTLKIPQADIQLILGATSRKKTLKIDQLEAPAILARLGLETQTTL